MALQPFRPPNRGTPSDWEAAFLAKLHLSLPCLEFGIPFQLASSDEFVVEGDGNLMSAVYSHPALNLEVDGLEPERRVDSYVLPHLPLGDARTLQAAQAGDAAFRAVNPSRLQAKRAAYDKLLRARDELRRLGAPIQTALTQLATGRTRLVRIFDREADEQGIAEAGMIHLLDADAEALLTRWEADLARARAAAAEARRRVVLAVHHAAQFRPAEDGMVHIVDDVHGTIHRLIPDIHDDIYGGPLRTDPCSEAPQEGIDSWEQRKRRTEIAIGQLMSSIGQEISKSPTRLREYSLMQSRRELIECEADVARKELRIQALQAMNSAISALRSLQDLKHEAFDVHLNRPTLLGNQVPHQDEILPMDVPFYPECKLQSLKELEITARNQTSARY